MTIDTNSDAFKAAAAQLQATLTVNLLRRHVLDNHIPRDEMPEWAAGLARAALEAYEAARPKPQTITGLPDTLPDGRKIVGWEWRKAGRGEWWFAGAAFCLLQGPALEARPVAITEPTNAERLVPPVIDRLEQLKRDPFLHVNPHEALEQEGAARIAQIKHDTLQSAPDCA